MAKPIEREQLCDEVSVMLARLPLAELLGVTLTAIVNTKSEPEAAISNVLSLISAMSHCLNVEGQITVVMSLRQLSDILEQQYLKARN